ncbi:hypothetical protein C7S15_3426 [Burkholderia cepacia]|nr:hypothetical protein [Burkholderia cepacia]
MSQGLRIADRRCWAMRAESSAALSSVRRIAARPAAKRLDMSLRL